MPRYSPKTLRELCDLGILMNDQGVLSAQLKVVVALLAEKHVHTAHQLSEKIGLNKNNVVNFVKGHVYHGNNPAHILTVTGQHVARFLFPDLPHPADKLIRILKGKETCETKPIGNAPKPDAPPTHAKYEPLKVGSGVTTGYKPVPGRPYLVRRSDGKWDLLIAPKNA